MEGRTGFKLTKRGCGAGEYDKIFIVPHKLTMHNYSIRAFISALKKSVNALYPELYTSNPYVHPMFCEDKFYCFPYRPEPYR